jgi:hypothetical protein
MKFDNAIQAIKALRAIPRGTVVLKPNVIPGGSTYELVIEGGGLGLKDAKAIVEACMELGVQRYKADNKTAAVREFLEAELEKLKPKVPNCNRCGDPLTGLHSAQPCDRCWEATRNQEYKDPFITDDIKF